MNLRHMRALQSGRNSDSGYKMMTAAKNDAGQSKAIIYLFDVIDSSGYFGVSASEFVRDLVMLDVDLIDLHINSPGGDVYDAIAMHSALCAHRATVATFVDGWAASAASYLAMAANPYDAAADTGGVRMARNAEIMIHDAWTVVAGNAADFAKAAEDLDRASANIADFYAHRAGGTVDEWRTAMRAETWYGSAEACKAGLADIVIDYDDDNKASAPAAMAAAWNGSMFAYANRKSAPAPFMPEAMKEPEGDTSEGSEPEPFSFDPEIIRRSLREAFSA